MNAGIRPAHEDGEPGQHGNRDAARLAAIDLEAAHRFLEHMAGGEPLTFQTFDDSNAKRRGLTRVFQGSFDEHARALGSLNDSGAGVFWMVNRGDGQGRRTQNILEVRALFLDLDGVALWPVLDTGVDPHAVVESSPGKWHVYWLVTGCPLSQFKPAQVALAARFGGDRTVIDLPRVLRVPGFLHRKGVPFQSRIERLVTAPPLDFETLVERLGLDIGGDDHLALPRVGTSTGEVGKVMTGRRHEHLRRRLTDFNWRGIPSEGIRASLHQINENECEPPKSRDEVDALLDDWLVRYAHQHGQDESQRGEPIDAEAQHFSVVPFADLEHNQPDPPVYWWDGYLPAGVVTLLGAHGGTGKSMMALMVCVSIALGRPLFGVPTRRGKAAYFSGEDGAQLIRYRLHWICDQLGVSVAELDSCLHILDATAGDPTLFRDAGAGGRRRATR